ncbi:heterokaryon incompatibility protein-domain-containing protein [Ustulina deusta]|nr:heterokaryon incompatibility protein-domain-containing protein [Ustulina deusta]
MCLVADLGERYLWVDSLCIIQDDISDKRQYLPMMGDIFNSAMVVVVAAVENAGSGLPGLRDHERRQSRFTETIQGIDFTFGQPQLQDYLSTTIWNTRGWTYQEAQLARRALVITDAQAFWSCRERSWCEDRFTEFPIHPRVPLGYNSLFTQSLQEGSRSIFLCYMGEYCQKVKEFSSRSFSDEKDQLWAFFGILKSLLSRFPQGYIWGMPKAKLDSALLWQADNAQNPSEPLIIPAEKGGWQNLMIPSWCWISKGTEVWYDNCYESVESMVDWHEPVHLEESRPQNGSQEEEVEEERARNLQSVIFPADQISRESKVFDFALLHFTTESAILRIHTLLPNTSKICPSCSMGSATLSLLSGRDIGSIRLPLATFSGKDEIQEEFILLSSTPISDDGDDDGDDDDGDDDDVQKAEEVKYYNIMLVRWSDDNKFASRIAWTEVAKSAWEECEKQRKTILILG